VERVQRQVQKGERHESMSVVVWTYTVVPIHYTSLIIY
jgi:hypothetical protein